MAGMDSKSQLLDIPSSAEGDGVGRPRLQLPMSCDPPRPESAKKLVWIVSFGSRMKS
jgi:hypothetical protein